MHPQETFHLLIQFNGINDFVRARVKDNVSAWLVGVGEEAFVDGAIDNLYTDAKPGATPDEQFDDLGGGCLPISVFRYDLIYLEELKARLEKSFGAEVSCELSSMSTEGWMEGWKESFKPIQTSNFYVYPPWLSDDLPKHLIPIEIEPGMAFGTGQHATTMLCLEAFDVLETCSKKGMLLDVGTGTGILAIAAKKYGYSTVYATDIDPDSIIASIENARVNNVVLCVQEGTLPETEAVFDVIFANIIFFVLKSLIPHLASKVCKEGVVVLSGILVEETEEMKKLALDCGLELLSQSSKDDWACQIYKRIY